MLYISEVGQVGKVKHRIKNDYCSFLEFTNHSYDKNLETIDVEGELQNLSGFKSRMPSIMPFPLEPNKHLWLSLIVTVKFSFIR